MRWHLSPGSAFPQWLCFLLKLEDTANCTTTSVTPRWVSYRSCSCGFVLYSCFWMQVKTMKASRSWSWPLLCALRLVWAFPEYDLLSAFYGHVYLLDSPLPAPQAYLQGVYTCFCFFELANVIVAPKVTYRCIFFILFFQCGYTC